MARLRARPIVGIVVSANLVAVLTALASLAPAGAAAADVSSTKHNLSVSGPGTVTAASETRICVFCHTPHTASPDAQLWNRNASTASYTPYASSSLDASPGQPTGSSRLCLSCHDGTIALGEVLSESLPIAMSGGITTLPPGESNLDIVLDDDHPVSFPFTPGLAAADGELLDPALLTGDVRLDAAGELQCTACHDPHDDTHGSFLVMDNAYSAICVSCHAPADWGEASHHSAAAIWNGELPDPWPHTPYLSVAENGCESCHDPHGAEGATRILNRLEEEWNCLACHNGHVASTDIEGELGKLSLHPVAATTGIHDPEEALPVSVQHVECVDCHNPHAARDEAAVAPGVSGRLRNVSGVDSDGNPTTPAAHEYEVCYKCHADSPERPDPATPRQIVQNNVRLEFDLANPSFHPVEGPGVNSTVPSLLPPWTTGSVLYCTDCHNNDSGAAAGGVDPNGPHGSDYAHLLGWRYETGIGIVESPSTYELCYRCHDRSSILDDESFGRHQRHIVFHGASCNVCHDPHGISSTQGSAVNHSHLINFDTAHVTENPDLGILEFVDLGELTGSCTLRCHGRRHNNSDY